MFGKVFTLVFRECSKARLLVWGYCPQLYLNLFLQNRHCSVIAIIIRFLYLLRTIICLIVSNQYKVWIGRDLEECHDCVDSGPLHMVLCIQLPPPPLSHYLLLYDGWHWGNLNTLSTETRGSIALSNTLDQLGPGFRLPHGAITDTVGGSHVSLWEQKGLNLQPVRHQAILLCSS